MREGILQDIELILDIAWEQYIESREPSDTELLQIERQQKLEEERQFEDNNEYFLEREEEELGGGQLLLESLVFGLGRLPGSAACSCRSSLGSGQLKGMLASEGLAKYAKLWRPVEHEETEVLPVAMVYFYIPKKKMSQFKKDVQPVIKRTMEPEITAEDCVEIAKTVDKLYQKYGKWLPSRADVIDYIEKVWPGIINLAVAYLSGAVFRECTPQSLQDLEIIQHAIQEKRDNMVTKEEADALVREIKERLKKFKKMGRK